MPIETISLAQGIRNFEQAQRDANQKLAAEYAIKEKGRTKEQSIYFTKPANKAKFDYFK